MDSPVLIQLSKLNVFMNAILLEAEKKQLSIPPLNGLTRYYENLKIHCEERIMPFRKNIFQDILQSFNTVLTDVMNYKAICLGWPL
jgi:hypothetical protein